MSVHLVHGSDEALVADKVAEIVRELVGDQDRSLVLEEFSGDFVMAGATEAASTPPFFTDRRVIVVRATSGFVADDVAVLVDFLTEPPDFTDLVIAWGSGRVADTLKKAVTKCGGRVVDPSPPTKAADRRDWWSEQIRGATSTSSRLLRRWSSNGSARTSHVSTVSPTPCDRRTAPSVCRSPCSSRIWVSAVTRCPGI